VLLGEQAKRTNRTTRLDRYQMKGVTVMSAYTKCKHLWIALAVPLALSCVVSPLFGQNQVMGEVDFHGATKVEKSSGRLD